MANIVFFLGPGHPNWSREGSEGKFQSGQGTDSCVVGVGRGGLLDKQDPEKLTSFSPDQHLNITSGRKLWRRERRPQLQGTCAYGANLFPPQCTPDWDRSEKNLMGVELREPFLS